ncbi:hypothetical protein KTE23_29035 [Burkholderia multivorans]|uniref:hypothetical protein n=1 Tax=Burkholderia multivorans TaxID=87883 RepID=UPI001C214D3D|nr:hypothetical protein [Burkholderia multivorans]MBU9420611.1 hypothetical protein [Burkholderia multivorans]
MTSGDIEISAAFLGLAASIAFAQTSRHLIVGPLSRAVALVSMPLAIGFIARLAMEFHWWTIMIVVVISLFVGIFNGIFARAAGRSILYSAQPIQAIFIVLATAGCWIPSAIAS